MSGSRNTNVFGSKKQSKEETLFKQGYYHPKRIEELRNSSPELNASLPSTAGLFESNQRAIAAANQEKAEEKSPEFVAPAPVVRK